MKKLGKKLGVRIREIREKEGLGLNELARALKVSRGYLSDIETGKKLPTLILLNRVADALRVTMRDFF